MLTESVASQIGGHTETEGDRRVLARRVADDAGRCRQAGERDQVDDLTATGASHPVDGRKRAVDGPEVVHLDQPPVDVDILLVAEAGDQDAGVVHPDVE